MTTKAKVTIIRKYFFFLFDLFALKALFIYLFIYFYLWWILSYIEMKQP